MKYIMPKRKTKDEFIMRGIVQTNSVEPSKAFDSKEETLRRVSKKWNSIGLIYVL